MLLGHSGCDVNKLAALVKTWPLVLQIHAVQLTWQELGHLAVSTSKTSVSVCQPEIEASAPGPPLAK